MHKIESMFRIFAISLWSGLLLAQAPAPAPAPVPTAPPPADVDQALRARISEFYQDQVDGKSRLAEPLVAEDSKDLYYSVAKPKYLSFEINRIQYSDDFTRAQAVVICETYVLVPGFVGKALKVPISSTWKLVDGQWFWYVDEAKILQTPFGKMSPGTGPPPTGGGMPAIPTPEQMQALANQLQTLVKADKPVVTLKAGGEEEVTLTNTATGLMNLSLEGRLTGIDAHLDHPDLKPKGTAVLSLHAHDGAKSGVITLHVDQTNQTIPIQVKIE